MTCYRLGIALLTLLPVIAFADEDFVLDFLNRKDGPVAIYEKVETRFEDGSSGQDSYVILSGDTFIYFDMRGDEMDAHVYQKCPRTAMRAAFPECPEGGAEAYYNDKIAGGGRMTKVGDRSYEIVIGVNQEVQFTFRVRLPSAPTLTLNQ